MGFFLITALIIAPDVVTCTSIEGSSWKVLKIKLEESFLPFGLSNLTPKLEHNFPKILKTSIWGNLEDNWPRRFQVLGLTVHYHSNLVHMA